jgi:acyl-CoA synthetase (NDP forming)
MLLAKRNAAEVAAMKVEHIRQDVVDKLQYALNPKSIAVIGASRCPGKVGHKVIDGLQQWGYKGKIYPINPRAKQVAGIDAYKRVTDVDDEIDLAFIAVPAHLVKSILEDCVAKNVKIAVIATSAFKEIGRGELQNELTQYCRDNHLPLIGPNLVGMGSPYMNFNCGFIPYLPKEGPVAMISQSGANLLAALGSSQKDHLGMSFFVGLGNKADVDFSEFIAYANQDEHTKAIAVYIEGLDSPEAFKEALQASNKPVVAIKVGGSKIGNKAAFAHTASENPESDEWYDTVLKESGALRATTWQQFLDTALALGSQPPLKGDNIVMITNGGGSGLLSCDHFERIGLPLHELKDISPDLPGRIRSYMPMFGSPLNPVDISGTATPIQYEGAIKQAIRDPNVDGVFISICPTAVTDVQAVVDALIDIYDAHKHLNKPVIMECQGGEECQSAIMQLRDHGIPAYPTAEQAVNAMKALYDYGQIVKNKEAQN